MVLEKIGTFGRYQLLVSLCAFFIPAFTVGSVSLNIVFSSDTPDHWCLVPSADHLNLTHDDFLALTAPMTGTDQNFRCTRYNRDYTNWTKEDVAARNLSALVEDVEVIACDSGWGYDSSIYPSTAVSDVRIGVMTICIYSMGWLEYEAESMAY